MNEGLEDIGVAVTAGLAAREATRGGAPASGKGGTCANCGAGIASAFCPDCGQAAHVHRDLRGLGHDLAHGVFHFEGRIWRTLPLLAWRPGELTRRYVAGERARFIPPMALFLFSVFVMFTTFALLAAPDGPTRRPSPDSDGIYFNAGDGGEVARPAGKQVDIDIGWPWLKERVEHAKKNPKLLLYKVKTSAYKFSWLLIPLSLPFLWLLFPFRRDVGLYDHAVFGTYSLAFMTLLVAALAVASALGLPDGLMILALFVIVPLHMYRQLRGAYRIGRVGAGLRTIAMLGFSLVVATLFATLLLWLEAE